MEVSANRERKGSIHFKILRLSQNIATSLFFAKNLLSLIQMKLYLVTCHSCQGFKAWPKFKSSSDILIFQKLLFLDCLRFHIITHFLYSQTVKQKVIRYSLHKNKLNDPWILMNIFPQESQRNDSIFAPFVVLIIPLLLFLQYQDMEVSLNQISNGQKTIPPEEKNLGQI